MVDEVDEVVEAGDLDVTGASTAGVKTVKTQGLFYYVTKYTTSSPLRLLKRVMLMVKGSLVPGMGK